MCVFHITKRLTGKTKPTLENQLSFFQNPSQLSQNYFYYILKVVLDLNVNNFFTCNIKAFIYLAFPCSEHVYLYFYLKNPVLPKATVSPSTDQQIELNPNPKYDDVCVCVRLFKNPYSFCIVTTLHYLNLIIFLNRN